MAYAKGNTEYYFVSLSFAGINQFRFGGSPTSEHRSKISEHRLIFTPGSVLRALSSVSETLRLCLP